MSLVAALDRFKTSYESGVRRIALRAMASLARTRVSPNALTAGGVTLCAVSAVLAYFEYRNELLFFWLGAGIFLLGSILDILDGALARAGGKTTPFGAFLDSTTDRVSEGFMLGAIALIESRNGNTTSLAFTIAAIAGSFLVSYTRAKAEGLGFSPGTGMAAVGIMPREVRLVVLCGGLVLGGLIGADLVVPDGGFKGAGGAALPPGMLVIEGSLAIIALGATLTVIQRILQTRAEARRQARADAMNAALDVATTEAGERAT